MSKPVVVVLLVASAACSRPSTVALQTQCTWDKECAAGFVCRERRCVAAEVAAPEATEPPAPEGSAAPVADFALTLSSPDVALTTHEHASVTIALERKRNADGEARFEVIGLPANVNAEAKATIASMATLRLDAGVGGAAGEIDLTVRATIGDVTKSAVLKLRLKKTVRLTLVRPTTDPVEGVRVWLDGVWMSTDATGSVTATLDHEAYDAVILTKDLFFGTTEYSAHMLQGLASPELTVIVAKPFALVPSVYHVTTPACSSPLSAATSVATWNTFISDRGVYASDRLDRHDCAVQIDGGDAAAPKMHNGRKYTLQRSTDAPEQKLAFGYVDIGFSDPASGDVSTLPVALGELTAEETVSGTATLVAPGAAFTSLSLSADAVIAGRGRVHLAEASDTLAFFGPKCAGARTVLKAKAFDPQSARRSERWIAADTSGAVTMALPLPPELIEPHPFQNAVEETTRMAWTKVPGSVSLARLYTNEASAKRYTFGCYTAGSACALPDLSLDSVAAEWAMPANAPGSWNVVTVSGERVEDLFGPVGVELGETTGVVTKETVVTQTEGRPFN